MQVEEYSNSRSRWIQRALIAVAAVALLAGAAYVWGNQLNADTQQASTQRSVEALASRYRSLSGLAAVRAVDSVAAPRTSALQGVAAVRKLEAAAAPRASALQGVAAVRAADGAAAAVRDRPSRAAGAIQAARNGSVERHVPGGGP
jgi:hypothetical protein